MSSRHNGGFLMTMFYSMQTYSVLYVASVYQRLTGYLPNQLLPTI